MKKTIALLALAVPLLAQEAFDFKTLDKLGANAKGHNEITLNGDMLKLASGMLGIAGNGAESIKPLVDNLKGVYIRSFEFDRDGQYSEADLEPFRAYLRQTKWNKIVSAHDGKEYSEIYLLPVSSSRLGGVAIIAAEAREVTVVYINGDLKAEDIEKLSGNLGIPDIKLDVDIKKDKKKDDEQ